MPAGPAIAEPTEVLLCGDWHGNTRWATSVIDMVPEFIPEGPRILLQLGDFGIWPGRFGEDYLEGVTEALREADAHLWFVDGNHEDHSRLYQLRQTRAGTDRYTAPYEITERITWLPRGYRWRWHDRLWLALGGATSVDRTLRTVGVDWWAGEALTYEDVTAARVGGQVDVMVTHDCPDGVPGALRHGNEVVPAWWELGPAIEHRRVLRAVVNDVRPEWLFHGHFHHYHDSLVDFGYGKLRVMGLDCDGVLTGNSVLLNIKTMQITNPWGNSAAMWAARRRQKEPR
ncbi:MAG TPA: metallophosphoesterase [Mycobacterium sp.]|jgi:hypothetical protein|nr:metallophosphoesterase [Mycobacterium sp.]